MSFRTIIYGLKPDINGKTILSYDLNSDEIVISNNLETIELRLNGKIITIQKAMYVNKRIFDDGKTFFYIATKQIRTEYVFDLLMDYAIKKLDTRAMLIATTRDKFVKELNQHRKLIAA